jgi:hypothetical protein
MAKFHYTSNGETNKSKGQRIFIDPEDVSSVVIDGFNIPLE